MILVVILCLALTTPALSQKSFFPPYLHNTRSVKNLYSNHLQEEPQQIYDFPIHTAATPPSLSKLYKPRPAELDKLLMEYHQFGGRMNIPHKRLNKVTDKNMYAEQLQNLKVSSPRFGRYQYVHPLVQRNGQKQSADYNKKMYYSKIKPTFISHNYNDNYIDNGYKTEEEVLEGDEEHPLSKYDFAYSVSHPEYHLNFGHRESKQGEFAKGMYYTQLPDGRIQHVEYEADENGYKPKLTYTDDHQGKYIYNS